MTEPAGPDPVPVRWQSLFADVPSAGLGRALDFWSAVSGASDGDPRGDRGQYHPLVPPAGDPHLWVQEVGRAAGGWHLDLHVDDVPAAAATAAARGARVVRRVDGLVTLESPAGLPFCLVQEDVGRPRQRAAAAEWPGGLHSAIDQICLDIPAAAFDDELEFWARLTGWPPTSSDLGEFRRLDVPAALPVRVLLQRLGDDDAGGIRAHADLSADDRVAEVTRHEALGAAVQLVAEHWTTLCDPAGLVYCVTDRTPADGGAGRPPRAV